MMFTNDTDLTLRGEFVNLRTRYFNDTYSYRNKHEKEGLSFEGFSLSDITFGGDEYRTSFLEYLSKKDLYYKDFEAAYRVLGTHGKTLEMEYSQGMAGGYDCDCCGVEINVLNTIGMYSLCDECDKDQERFRRFNEYEDIKIDDIFVLEDSNHIVYVKPEDYEDVAY